MNKNKTQKGITLIALIITIIIMLILVGVTVSIAINGGLFSTAKNAAAKTQYEADKESLFPAVIGALNDNAEVDFTELDKNLPNGFTGTDGKYTSEAGNTFYVDENGNITDGNPPTGGDHKSVSELFDANEEKLSAIEGKEDNDFTTDNKLHIGDFINYNAGIWTQAELDAIKVGTKGADGNGIVSPNGERKLPSGNFQFGGFAVGDNRDGNAVSYSDPFNYYKDSDDQPIAGWRLFDVDEEESTITLISAGCPEDFLYPYGTNYAYVSEYILSGNQNISASDVNFNTYTKRDWSNYVVEPATGANVLTKGDLDKWYEKYMGDTEKKGVYDGDTFKAVYKTRYENLIDNYSYYWLASARDGNYMYLVYPAEWSVNDWRRDAFGVRVLVTLKSDVQLVKTGKKTVKNIENDNNRSDKLFTYNVWDIK